MIPAFLLWAWGQACWLLTWAKAVGGWAWVVKALAAVAAAFWRPKNGG